MKARITGRFGKEAVEEGIMAQNMTIVVDGQEITGEYIPEYRASDGYRGRAVFYAGRYYRLDKNPDAGDLATMRRAYGDKRED